MEKREFHEGWEVMKGTFGVMEKVHGGKACTESILLPHDAMIHEERTPRTKNGHHTGFYPGGVYTYMKQFFVPKEWENQRVLLEFEGVYKNAFVYVNEDYAGSYPYGYTQFFIELDKFFHYGEINTVRVSIKNDDENTSRWYTGSGIYRDVTLWIGDELHILPEGVSIDTSEVGADGAVVTVSCQISYQGRRTRTVFLETVLQDENGRIAGMHRSRLSAFEGEEYLLRQRIFVADPLLWSCETPHLYTCICRIVENQETIDMHQELFGIRTLTLDAYRGLRINGKEIKLRGSCIHHDNGILGACTLEPAEERRCLQLKEAGFNCIRSAHNPVSKAMLRVCDRIGMLVMDETWDVWQNSKTDNDYSLFFNEWWERDVEAMVAKDYNHPSVIFYSIGNEIQEAGTPRGAALGRRIANRIKELDNTRYTVNSVNGMFSIFDHIQEMIADVKADIRMEQLPESEAEGYDGFNDFMGMLHGEKGDRLIAHPYMGDITEELYESADVAGYNYMTARYVTDHTRYPNRVILGSETHPSEIFRLWNLVKAHPHLIGDMTWTGYDYLGEAGCGVFYYDGTRNFTSHWPDRTSGMGDIDITGERKPISFYREIVFGLREDPYIAVLRMDRDPAKASHTAWMFKDNISCWTWEGYEGKKALVDVYSCDEEVELFLNGESLGRKKAGEEEAFTAVYEVPYHPGILRAVGYTKGVPCSSYEIETAQGDRKLSLAADRSQMKAGGRDVVYLTVNIVGQNGAIDQNAKTIVTVEKDTDCDAFIAAVGNGDPQAFPAYDDLCWPVYHGRLLIAVRSGMNRGYLSVSVSADGMERCSRTIEII